MDFHSEAAACSIIAAVLQEQTLFKCRVGANAAQATLYGCPGFT